MKLTSSTLRLLFVGIVILIIIADEGIISICAYISPPICEIPFDFLIYVFVHIFGTFYPCWFRQGKQWGTVKNNLTEKGLEQQGI